MEQILSWVQVELAVISNPTLVLLASTLEAVPIPVAIVPVAQTGGTCLVAEGATVSKVATAVVHEIMSAHVRVREEGTIVVEKLLVTEDSCTIIERAIRSRKTFSPIENSGSMQKSSGDCE